MSLGLAMIAFSLALILRQPQPAFACNQSGPCSSGATTITCPQVSPDGSLDVVITESFEIPKDAQNVKVTMEDAGTGEELNSDNPPCDGTTMTVTQQRISGPDKDTLQVTYRIHNDGSGNPSDQRNVIVQAGWDRTADLGIEKHASGGKDVFGTDQEVTWLITIHNYGPAPAPVVELGDFFWKGPADVRLISAQQVDGPPAKRLTITQGQDVAPRVDGVWESLKKDDEVTIAVRAVAPQAGDYQNEAGVVAAGESTDDPSPDPHENDVTVPFKIRAVPDSKIKRAGARGMRGQATPPPRPSHRAVRRSGGTALRRVQVAILRLTGGVSPLTGQMPPNPSRRSGKCEWVGGKTGTLRKRKADHGVCDSPVWLNASGSTHWSFKLTHQLPPGRYVFYSRAVGSGGLGETNFTAKDGNRKVVRVH